jgi:hypothetical protein
MGLQAVESWLDLVTSILWEKVGEGHVDKGNGTGKGLEVTKHGLSLAEPSLPSLGDACALAELFVSSPGPGFSEHVNGL